MYYYHRNESLSLANMRKISEAFDKIIHEK